MMTYLAEIGAVIDAAGTTVTLRYGSSGHTTGPAETPADAWYAPYLDQPCSMRRELAGEGRDRIGYGNLVLKNIDGALDALAGYGFDGQPLTLLVGEQGAPYPSGWTTVLRGTVEQVEITWKSVSFRLRDRLAELDKPLCPNRYAGTNSLPAGVEGTADDLKGRVKPRLYGKCFNLAPPCVNTSSLTYQINDGAIAGVDAVYDRQALLSAGAAIPVAAMQAAVSSLTCTANTTSNYLQTPAAHNYTTADPVAVWSSGTPPAPLAATTQYYARVTSSDRVTLHPTAADATANTNIIDITTTGSGTHYISNNRPAQGYYHWCSDAAGSYLRLGSSPAGQVTADATQGASLAVRTAARILKQIALDAGVASGDIDANDVANLDADNSSEVGIYVDDEGSVLEAMDGIAASVGGWYGFDRSGTLRMARIEAPAGSPVAEFDGVTITAIERLAGADVFRGLPAWRTTVRHSRNYTPQPSDIAGSVGDARRAWAAQEWRAEVAEDAAVRTKHLLAPERSVDTLLTASAAAATEAARRQTLFGAERESYRIAVRLDDARSTLSTVDLGAVVLITYPRFGLSAGKLFVVLAIEPDLRRSRLDLVVWG